MPKQTDLRDIGSPRPVAALVLELLDGTICTASP